MKKILPGFFFLFSLVSCSKKNDTTNTGGQSENYLTTSAGSTWNYHEIDSSGNTPVNSDYTLTSSSDDTTINGRVYHIYDNSAGEAQYLNRTGKDYYEFSSLPVDFSSSTFETLYLKDSSLAGTSWNQTQSVMVTGIPFPVPFTLTYKIAEKGITKVVNSVAYSNVIHVSGTISSSLIPSGSLTSSLEAYYAPKYGMIESSTKINLNYTGIIAQVALTVRLVSASLK